MPDEGNVNAILGSILSKTHFQGSGGLTAPILQGTGLIVQGDVNSKGALEIALFYTPVYYIRSQGVGFRAEQVNLFHVSLGYRYWLMESFSLGAAFFSTYATGDVWSAHNDFAPPIDVDTSARDITEYGFDLALQYEAWTRGRIGIVIDTRFSYVLTKKDSEISDRYGILLGIRYLVQTKEEAKISRPGS